MSELQNLINLIDDQVDLFDETPPRNQVISDTLFSDALAEAIKPALFPYCLKRLFSHKGGK